jgi:hypothetical protein
MNPFAYEPVAVSAVVRAIFAAAVAWGFKATPDQILMTVLALEAIMLLPTRQNVTSQNTLHRAGLSQSGVTARAEQHDADNPLSKFKSELKNPDKDYDS